MKDIAAIGTGAVLGFAISYLIVGYICADWNAWNWDAFIRFLQAVIGAGFGAVGGMFYTAGRA